MATGSLQVNRDIILATKRQHLKQQMKIIPDDAVLALAQMQNRPRGILNVSNERKDIAIIAQVSRHEIYDPVTSGLHCLYNGADAIAFFTDHSIYDNAYDDMLMLARAIPDVPVLFQNYTLNEYEVMAARASDASGMFMYSALTDEEQLRKNVIMAQRWKMISIVQVSDEAELQAAIKLSPHVIAVGDNLSGNVRSNTEDLIAIHSLVPSYIKTCLAQTIYTLDDLELVLKAPVDAVILSENMIKNDRVATRIKQMIGIARSER